MLDEVGTALEQFGRYRDLQIRRRPLPGHEVGQDNHRHAEHNDANGKNKPENFFH